jgi:hypothetical protein
LKAHVGHDEANAGVCGLIKVPLPLLAWFGVLALIVVFRWLCCFGNVDCPVALWLHRFNAGSR